MTTQVAQRPIPRKLDDAMVEALSDLVRKGNYYHDACALVEISEPCLYGWIKLGVKDEKDGLSKDESIYFRLVKSLQKARAEARAAFVAVIHEAATVKREWLPAITYLERTDPGNWGRKDRTPPPMLQDNRVFNIIVKNPVTKDLIESIGERTKRLAIGQEPDDNSDNGD